MVQEAQTMEIITLPAIIQNTSGNSSKDSGFESQSSEPRYAHYQVDEQEKKPEEKKKGRHHRLHNDKAASSGFGRKAGNTITLAVIFGLVAGLVFQAVNMVSDKYFKKETQTAVGYCRDTYFFSICQYHGREKAQMQAKASMQKS